MHSWPSVRRASSLLALVAAAGLVVTGCSTGSPLASGRSTASAVPRPRPPAAAPPVAPAATPVAPAATTANSNHRMFAFYYLWWDTQHWHARLGPNYPYAANPKPPPATISGYGCTVTNNYPGNQLTDVASPLWTQDNPNQIRSDVTLAAQSGLAGFAVSWAGTGQPHQTPMSSAFNHRLAMVVAAVHQINKAGTPFSLWIAYISSARIRSTDEINNDLTYLSNTYGRDPAFDHSNSGRPTLIMMGSRKYPISVLNAFSARWRPHFYLVADENWSTWDAAKAADFDADQYYWSSQNPLTNKASFAQLDRLAAEVRSSRNPDGTAKKFFSPLAPGYNKVIGGGSGCVPRLGGRTMQDLYTGNSSAHPDGWMVISWNEIDEGTYIVPLERYGNQSIDTLKSIIDGPATG